MWIHRPFINAEEETLRLPFTDTCTAPNAVRCKWRRAGDSSLTLGMTLSRLRHCEPPQAARQSPGWPLGRQGGGFLASLGMTLSRLRHCEPPQAAWQSPAKPLRG